MSYINKLPTEILQEIFGYLESDDKEDLETCLLVCKLWNSVASGLFWDRVLFCMSSASSCRQLLDNISHEHSTLDPKVQHLDYEVCDEHESDDNEEYVDPIPIFISIVNMCNNITQLCLLSGKVHEALKGLVDQQENVMPYIQFLNLQSSAVELEKDSSLTSLHVRANYKHRKSITYLLLPYLDGKEDIFREYGGITKYLLDFPNLDKLECENVKRVNFDLPILLEYSTNLNDIELNGACHLTTQTKIDNDDDQRMSSRSALKHIHFRFEKLDIDTIKYLTRAIKDIHVISLLPCCSNRTGEIVATKGNIVEVFNQFTQQCNNIGHGHDHGYEHDHHEHAHALFRSGDHVVALGQGDHSNTTYHDSTDEDEDIYDSEWEAEMEAEMEAERLAEWEERQMYREMAYEAMLEEEEEENRNSENDEFHDGEDEDLSDEDDSDYQDAELSKELDQSEHKDNMSYEEDNDSEHDELSYEEY